MERDVNGEERHVNEGGRVGDKREVDVREREEPRGNIHGWRGKKREGAK